MCNAPSAACTLWLWRQFTAELPTDDEFKQIDFRIRFTCASEVDKWRHYKYLYMYGWGIDQMDEAFVKQIGTHVSCCKVKAEVSFCQG